MNSADLSRQEMIDMLVWQFEAGVESALIEQPENWLDRAAPAAPVSPQISARQSPIAQSPAAPNPRAASPAPTPIAARANSPANIPAPARAASMPDMTDTSGALARAKELASGAKTLEDLRQALEGFDGCTLKQSANGLVFADGNPDADIMLIGEAPGREEDMQGLPFVGSSGQLLDRILGSIGLDRTKVYIANTVPWRPPGNRAPSPMETQICRPFIERQAELVAPKIVIALGGAAAKQMLAVNTGILRLRGQVHDLTLGAHSTKCLPTLHPSYLLKQPAQKKLVWQDMQKLAAMMGDL